MVGATSPRLKLMLVQANGNLYLALIPALLTHAELDCNFKELGIDAAQVFELADWRTSSQNVAVACVPPCPGAN